MQNKQWRRGREKLLKIKSCLRKVPIIEGKQSFLPARQNKDPTMASQPESSNRRNLLVHCEITAPLTSCLRGVCQRGLVNNSASPTMFLILKNCFKNIPHIVLSYSACVRSCMLFQEILWLGSKTLLAQLVHFPALFLWAAPQHARESRSASSSEGQSQTTVHTLGSSRPGAQW